MREAAHASCTFSVGVNFGPEQTVRRRRIEARRAWEGDRGEMYRERR